MTTATDLANPLPDKAVDTLADVTGKDDFPCRLVVALQAGGSEAADGINRITELAKRQSDKLRFSIVKLVADGSIQGFSARLKWPGYHNGAENGLWYIEPARLAALIDAYNEAGIQIHIHTNGDECTEVALDAIEAALCKNPWRDHRHTLQHCQMADRAQFKRMRALGVGVNLFSNHIYYWGDAHITTTMGPDRAARLDDAGARWPRACRWQSIPMRRSRHLRRYLPLGARSIACRLQARGWAARPIASPLIRPCMPLPWAQHIR